MSSSYTVSATDTFTITHARQLASKVATDLKRMQRFYGYPSDASIADYELEITELLKAKCVDEVTYGFMKNDKWLEPTLRYKARDLNGYGNDDDPGRITPGLDVSGASFYSFLSYNSHWYDLSEAEKEAIKSRLPFKRGTASEPTVLNGLFIDDKTYTSGGVSISRSTIRKF